MTSTNSARGQTAHRRAKRAASYARRSDSRGKRTDERSVEEQEAANTACCERSNWALDPTRLYRDNDLSASPFSKKERPEWNRLLADLDAGLIDVLVLWEASRAMRKAYEWSMLVHACRENRVLIHITSDRRSYNPTIFRDYETLLEDGIDAEKESHKTSQRTTRAIQDNARKGRPHAIPAYGYRAEYSRTGEPLRVIVPEEAEIVREILSRVGHSEPISAIARDLNTRGIDAPSVAQAKREGKSLPETRMRKGKLLPSTPPQWSPAMIRRICTNRTYIAQRAFTDEIVTDDEEILSVEKWAEATWEAIAEEAVFWDAFNVLNEPQRKTHKPGKALHLCSFAITCGVCGSYLSRKGGRTAKAAERYQCYSNGSCVAINKEWLDEYISELVCRRLAKPDIYQDLITQDEGETRRLNARLEELQGRHNEAVSLFTKGKLSAIAMSAMEAELLPQIDEAERAIQNATTRIPAVLQELTADIKGPNRIQTIKARWKKLGKTGVAPQKDVIRALFEYARVNKATIPGARFTDSQRVEFKFRGSE